MTERNLLYYGDNLNKESITVSNLLAYVNEGFYNSTIIHPFMATDYSYKVVPQSCFKQRGGFK